MQVDTTIRALSHKQHSIDDLAPRSFSVEVGSFLTPTGTVDDLVSSLNAVLPYNWMSFLPP